MSKKSINNQTKYEGDQIISELKQEIDKLFKNSRDISQNKFTYDLLKGLPEPVQRYFKYSLVEGQSYLNNVRLLHSGEFRLKKKWFSIRGEEYFTIDEPGFIWLGKIPLFSAKDRYYNGEGRLTVKLFSKIKIIDERGINLNQAEFLRWLGEAPWFPTALLPSSNLRWEAISDNSAKIIFSKYNQTTEGVFNFEETGKVTKFTAKRFYNDKIEDWTGYYYNYQIVNGMKIPFNVEVEWNLDTGDFKYAKFKIDKIEYNKSMIFSQNG